MEIQHAPKKTPTENWTARQIPWNRIHLDFAGPFEGQLFLVMVDAYTKWVEVRRVPSRHSRLVIKELRQVFATFGVPDTIVSDNDAAFSSLEIQEFYKRNGMKSLFIAPYNPQANGQAERTVQSARNSLRKLKDGDWETRLSIFLLKQHSTPVTTTGKTPAELMFGRNLQTLLNKIKPGNQEEENELPRKSRNIRSLELGMRVRMRNYRAAGPKWVIATIIKKLGKRNCEVKEENVGIIHKRDIDQLVALPQPLQKDTPGCSRNRLLDLATYQPTEEEGDDNPVDEQKQTADEETQDEASARRKRPKRKCVGGSKNRYRESLLDASIVDGLP
ncbi:uncharacterized protein K02A2.6-like [Neodiprion virginianus]|uniref:uncharacterized protein K02A2.6-like n=1 Tax=Neodiprion virginianus TaxID=2961670 RepID=UPI001EE6C6AE|nr:uncharacterized protein K02A2.6-like [Neodiprion virginianus]